MIDQENAFCFPTLLKVLGQASPPTNLKHCRPENKLNTYYFDDFGFILIGGKMVDQETSLYSEKREKTW